MWVVSMAVQMEVKKVATTAEMMVDDWDAQWAGCWADKKVVM